MKICLCSCLEKLFFSFLPRSPGPDPIRSFDDAYKSQVHPQLDRDSPEYVEYLEGKVKRLQQQVVDMRKECSCHGEYAEVELFPDPSMGQHVLQEDNVKKAAEVVDEFFKNIKVSQSKGSITANDERYILCKWILPHSFSFGRDMVCVG